MYFFSRLRPAAALLKKQTPRQIAIRHSGDAVWVYRRLAPEPPKIILFMAEFVGFVMWYWILYHCWTQPEHITGHFPYPDTSKWTDEELGIPPDEEG